jgi:2-iminobutanoate/2-iminopropanoate deaminase
MAAPTPPYRPALRAGDLLYISGQIGLKDGELVEGGLAAQMDQSFDNLRATLEANGAKISDIVKTTVFLVDINAYGAMNERYAEFFGSDFPSRSAMAVAALPRGAEFEIEAIAYLGNTRA